MRKPDFHREHHQSTITKLCEELEETKRQCQRQKTLTDVHQQGKGDEGGNGEADGVQECRDPQQREDHQNCRWYTSSANQRATVDLQKDKGRVKHLQEGPGKIPCFISQRKAEV